MISHYLNKREDKIFSVAWRFVFHKKKDNEDRKDGNKTFKTTTVQTSKTSSNKTNNTNIKRLITILLK